MTANQSAFYTVESVRTGPQSSPLVRSGPRFITYRFTDYRGRTLLESEGEERFLSVPDTVSDPVYARYGDPPLWGPPVPITLEIWGPGGPKSLAL